jgi:hypothetical protein
LKQAKEGKKTLKRKVKNNRTKDERRKKEQIERTNKAWIIPRQNLRTT